MVNINKIKNRIPLLDLKKQYDILADADNNTSVRLMVVFTFIFSILYFIFPFDIIPDIILGFGYLDDLSLYMMLREIAYTSSDQDLSVRESLIKIFKSKVSLIVGLVLIILILAMLLILYGINI